MIEKETVSYSWGNISNSDQYMECALVVAVSPGILNGDR